MSYCVNCGVELDGTASGCPLCGTAVNNPAAPVDLHSPTPFPPKKGTVPPVSQTELALLISSMLLAMSLACGIINFFVLRTSIPWCVFVIGACVMLWLIIVPALLSPELTLSARLLIDWVAVTLYVMVIAYIVDGLSWFVAIALPALLTVAVIVMVLLIINHRHRRSILANSIFLLGALPVLLIVVELVVDHYITGEIKLQWSLVMLICMLALMMPLIIIRLVPNLRSEARKRFHL